MSVEIDVLWFVHCRDCTLARHYMSEVDAERAAEEHDQLGVCPGDAPWVDKKPRRRRIVPRAPAAAHTTQAAVPPPANH